MDWIDELLQKVVAELAASPGPPESTYRLQFHAGFTFRDARALVPYLHSLGVTHCYASPYFKARPGSQHGYDISDHGQLNPEIGSDADFAAWVEALRSHGMGQLLDFVPNHVGVVGNENAWWQDVLENGPGSPYAGYFDIAWHATLRAQLRDRVLLPILGDPYGKALESGQIRLQYADGTFSLTYFDHRLPVDPRSYEAILAHGLDGLAEHLGRDADALAEYLSIVTAIRHLPRHVETEPPRIAERRREKEVVKRRLSALSARSAAVRAWLDRLVEHFNGSTQDRHSFDDLHRLLEEQAYRLSYWRVAADETNYRRFFDLNELAALSMERLDVFLATHDLVLRLLNAGDISGLRIDHPDGLYDPKQYLERLQEHFILGCAGRLFKETATEEGPRWADVQGLVLERINRLRGGDEQLGTLATSEVLAAADALRQPLYVVVEKILGRNEALPANWATHGTSGYDFLNAVNGLFVDGAAAGAFTRLYAEFTGLDEPFAEVLYQKKLQIMQVALSSELHVLAHQLDRLAQDNRSHRDFTLTGLRHVLRQVISCFPVYRSYISDEGVQELDRRHVELAVRRAMLRSPAMSHSLFRFLRDTLLLQCPEEASKEYRQAQRDFVGKFQQVTAPVMAKGLEDTSFYTYTRLLSLNEVGGDPSRFGVSPEDLHRYLKERQARWPWSLSPLSTHDTKRSEDVRARLNVLSEMPDDWAKALQRWANLNEPHRVTIEDEPAPDRNEEYFLYQTLLGAWPLEPYSSSEYAAFVERIHAYVQKALYEAKTHTSWISPNLDYDEAVRTFVARMLDPALSGEFLADFRAFQRRIAQLGLLNSLAQTVLRLTAPGVPDTYQGTEVWDFSLVDPDNRRPVAHDRQQRLLREPNVTDLPLADLLATIADGRLKLHVTATLLRWRRDCPGLFSQGDYVPLEVRGEKRAHFFAFLRQHRGHTALVAIPRLLANLVQTDRPFPFKHLRWQDTSIALPEELRASTWRDVLGGKKFTPANLSADCAFLLNRIDGQWPVVVLASQP